MPRYALSADMIFRRLIFGARRHMEMRFETRDSSDDAATIARHAYLSQYRFA